MCGLSIFTDAQIGYVCVAAIVCAYLIGRGLADIGKWW